jgi:hypothetical protein
MCKEAPMTNHTRASRYTRLFGGLAALMLALAALLTAPSAEALRSRSSGAGNCVTLPSLFLPG